ncbi:unnamed protein product [Cladocopium goreaui]|uniref:Uncharacterized protein n=1 Tax=Cladocopium goreaui TaxID=2562237 RepID=A0A9P1FFI4_9DINO|nr:unnamed protein product [Cladocopium goreaui]
MLRKQFSEFQAWAKFTSERGYAAAAASSSGKRSEVPMGINASPLLGRAWLEGGDPGQWESQKNKGEGWVWNQTPQESKSRTSCSFRLTASGSSKMQNVVHQGLPKWIMFCSSDCRHQFLRHGGNKR